MSLVAILFALVLAGGPQLPIRPDPALTPGAVAPVTAAQVCTPGYSARARHVTQKQKRAAFARYGLAYARGFEVDHLISLELGGSNDDANLWPQSYGTQPWNARRKDVLENTMRRAICAGRLDIRDAQRAIATDWIAAYEKFVARKAVR